MDQLKPRQLDIMQNLAKMLGEKGPVKITTSLLAISAELPKQQSIGPFQAKKRSIQGWWISVNKIFLI